MRPGLEERRVHIWACRERTGEFDAAEKMVLQGLAQDCVGYLW